MVQLPLLLVKFKTIVLHISCPDSTHDSKPYIRIIYHLIDFHFCLLHYFFLICKPFVQCIIHCLPILLFKSISCFTVSSNIIPKYWKLPDLFYQFLLIPFFLLMLYDCCFILLQLPFLSLSTLNSASFSLWSWSHPVIIAIIICEGTFGGN